MGVGLALGFGLVLTGVPFAAVGLVAPGVLCEEPAEALAFPPFCSDFTTGSGVVPVFVVLAVFAVVAGVAALVGAAGTEVFAAGLVPVAAGLAGVGEGTAGALL
jgi:hypothetical protein